jgi:lysophospholipid acyltransferase (LPLAT)-like uncharacterized protein
MKGLVRAPWVQATLGVLLAGWLKFCFATMRWTREGLDGAEQVWAAETGVIVCFWHSRVAVSPPTWPYGRAQEPRAMISLSPDGEFVARAVALLGIPAIRGSSRKKTRRGFKDKRGTEAFRDVLRWVRAGNCIAITPDGPRGPAQTMAEGAILLARMTRAPVLMLGLAAKPAFRLDTWDKALVPLPFSRGAIVWGEPFVETAEDSETVRGVWKARLDALTDRAEALLA